MSPNSSPSDDVFNAKAEEKEKPKTDNKKADESKTSKTSTPVQVKKSVSQDKVELNKSPVKSTTAKSKLKSEPESKEKM